MKRETSTKGFTLIEVLVVVAVTGILMVLASVILINTIRNSKKAEITSEARQIGALVIDRLQKDAREADSLTVNASGNTLTINKTSGPNIIWQCVDGATADDNDYITRQSGATAVTITNRDPIDGVSWSGCGFSPTGVSSNLATFTVTFTEGVGVQTGPQEYQVSVPFVTSISVRSF